MEMRGASHCEWRRDNTSVMREEIVRLKTEIQRITSLLRSEEPLAQADHAIVTSLAWHLLAALHTRKHREEPVNEIGLSAHE
jgi:hypothetical protein